MAGAQQVIGIDFGATSIKAALVDRSGDLLAQIRLKTRPERTPEQTMDDLAELIERLSVNGTASSVGVGFCGMVDAENGVVLHTTDTLPGWQDVPLSVRLSEKCGLPVFVDNDSNAAALGEARWGAGRGKHSLALFTLGTGVGGGLVLDGRVWRGAGQMAGHLGHLKIGLAKKRCACGSYGCLEAHASAWALKRATGLDARQVFDRARSGDARMMKLVDQAARALGQACAHVACVLNPEVIAIGGGLARSWSQLRSQVHQQFQRCSLEQTARSTYIVKARLGDRAGPLGAALLALEHND